MFVVKVRVGQLHLPPLGVGLANLSREWNKQHKDHHALQQRGGVSGGGEGGEGRGCVYLEGKEDGEDKGQTFEDIVIEDQQSNDPR